MEQSISENLATVRYWADGPRCRLVSFEDKFNKNSQYGKNELNYDDPDEDEVNNKPEPYYEEGYKCFNCGEFGHKISDCPSRPPPVCANCQSEGHQAFECELPRMIDRGHVQDVPADQAWELIRQAICDHDIDDVKNAVEIYVKACPDITYQQLEVELRKQRMGVYLIAIEKELAATYTNMDLQGNLNKTYSVSWRWSPKPARPREIQCWPSSPEENLRRLEDAGEPTNRGVPNCSNCNTLGHNRKDCPEEAIAKGEPVSVLCFNCEKIGHRVRDCPEPRVDKFACKNCQKSGHNARDCPEPRSAEGVECKKCNGIGHFARDCPLGSANSGACHNCGQEGHRKNDCPNEAVIICRNCDGTGHISRECPHPRDYSRVKCQNCEKFGHTKIRCTEPVREDQTMLDDAHEGDENGHAVTDADNYGWDASHQSEIRESDQKTGTVAQESWELSAASTQFW